MSCVSRTCTHTQSCTQSIYSVNMDQIERYFKPLTAKKFEYHPATKGIDPRKTMKLQGYMRNYACCWSHFVSMFLWFLEDFSEIKLIMISKLQSASTGSERFNWLETCRLRMCGCKPCIQGWHVSNELTFMCMELLGAWTVPVGYMCKGVNNGQTHVGLQSDFYFLGVHFLIAYPYVGTLTQIA